jgi:hypothetical protein
MKACRVTLVLWLLVAIPGCTTTQWKSAGGLGLCIAGFAGDIAAMVTAGTTGGLEIAGALGAFSTLGCEAGLALERLPNETAEPQPVAPEVTLE